MQHEDFLNEYRFIRNKEIHALNDALMKHFSGEYHFENHPYVVAAYSNTDEPVKAKVMAVKALISAESGILLQTAEIECDGDDYDFEVGYMGISFGDIDSKGILHDSGCVYVSNPHIRISKKMLKGISRVEKRYGLLDKLFFIDRDESNRHGQGFADGCELEKESMPGFCRCIRFDGTIL
mgnify:CR=1 FL=1